MMYGKKYYLIDGECVRRNKKRIVLIGTNEKTPLHEKLCLKFADNPCENWEKLSCECENFSVNKISKFV